MFLRRVVPNHHLKVRLRLAWLAPLLALTILLIASPAEAHAPGVSLSGIGTATIDGVISEGEWDGAGSADFLVNIP